MPELERQRQYWDQEAESAAFTLPVDTNLLSTHLASDARILDFGCGYGRILADLAKAGFTNLSGLDPSSKMIERVRLLAPAARTAVIEGFPISEPDGSFDAVLLMAVLTCVPQNGAQRSLLRELHRILRPGGFVYVADFLVSRDPRNRRRYEIGLAEHSDYGTFTLAKGLVHRHHDPRWVAELLSPFERIAYDEFSARTRRGNPGRGFRFFGQKPNVPAV